MSTQRSFRGIDSQLKYFVALMDNTGGNPARLGFTPAQLSDALASDEGTRVLSNMGSVINTNNAGQFIRTINNDESPSYSQADQFRDMGKELYIQTNAANAYIYKLVQRISGQDTEGVSSNSDVFYSLVWAAKGEGNPKVKMIRTGY